MTARILDGKKLAAEILDHTREEVDLFRERTGSVPGLSTVLVGDDPASEVYVAGKRRKATAAGMADFHQHLPATATESEVAAMLEELAADSRVSGILLQLPLPGYLDAASLVERIPAHKDVDGLTTASAGLLGRKLPGLRPCTPQGVVELLDAAAIDVAGRRAVVVGRSMLVGAPLAQMLTHRDATVTLAHSRTKDLVGVTRSADILVAAAGVSGLITAAHVAEGTVVVDVGIHRTPDGLVGDVRFDEARERASWITPVPGGVGPLTIAMVLRNTVQAAQYAAD
ncbi:bifunctional methylenetetrahydrofolate dehydrogenase/methenyltetrahydrofolate cyclohydrolase FolD [Sciscionella marina]|uniref:bifunctional methylenetetrahydrofolate dehydrogenase/methenyltetrahydrofolate cyclohydrolase FolD n=1 Tax=Sciscionella marina TaxID=508770 RepID=UPI00036BB40B|nr:bifunctional methylenetetrahydrofolate dehydrogenase/methenyltetrahydrofolate cyclohydrolase FolD [Sciscionella marina]